MRFERKKSHLDDQKLQITFLPQNPLKYLQDQKIDFPLTFTKTFQNPHSEQTPSKLFIKVTDYYYHPSNNTTPPP